MANGVNRFYNPTQSQYISQYIPQQLPTDLLVAGLANKEKQYQQELNKINMLGDWTQEALPGYDTQTVNNYKQEIRNKLDSWYNQDLTSADFQREYMDFTRKLKDNTDLKAISKNLAHDKEAQEIIQKYRTGNANDYEAAFAEDYLRRRKIYTSETGKGYAGDIQLGDKNILKGTDLQAAKEELFDHLKASGSESLADLGNGIYYKNGWRGIGQKQIEGAVSKQIDDFYNSRAGEQIGARFDVMNAPANVPISIWKQNMSPKEAAEYEEKRKTYVAQDVLSTGETFKFSDTNTNKDTAMNKARDEKMLEGPAEQPFTVPGYTVAKDNKDFKTDYDKAAWAVTYNNNLRKDVSNLNTVLGAIKNGTSLQQVIQQNPNLLNELKGIDGIDQAMITGVIANNPNAIREVQNLINVKNKQIENNKLEVDVFNNNMGNAMNENYGRIFNGNNYSEIQTKGDQYMKVNNPDFKTTVAEMERWKNDPRVLENYIQHVNKFGNQAAKDAIAYSQANDLYLKAMDGDNPFFKLSYKGAGQSVAPNAIAVNPNKEYVSRVPKFNKQGQFVGHEINGKSKTVDQELKANIESNPALYTFKDLNGKVINVNPKEVRIGSINRTRPDDDKLNLNAEVTFYKKVPYVNAEGEEVPNKFVDKPFVQQVIIQAPKSNYDEKRAKEFESGILSGNVNAKSPYPEGVAGVRRVGKYTVYELNDQASEIQKANYREYNAIVNKALNKQLQDAKDQRVGGEGKTITDNFGGSTVTFKVYKVDDNNTGGRYTANIFGDEINADSFDELESEIYNIKNQYLIRR